MTQTTIGIGIFLVVLGLVGFFVTGMQSITALIPTFFGVLFLILGLIARKESARKIAMHIAMVLGLLGLIGTFPGLIKMFPLLLGAEVARPAAIITQAIMALLLIYYLVVGIRTFIAARNTSTTDVTNSD
jgi:hypothetical protein